MAVAEPPLPALAPTVATVEVRAARLPPPAGDAAFSVVRIAPERLAAEQRLDEALESVPGVSLFRRTSSLAANPTTQGISLRGIAGSGASRALVTLDGVPQNDPFGGWVIWTALPTEAIEGAEILRGAGSGPYGAGALTGTVALEERTQVAGGQLGGLAGELSLGDLGTRRAAAVAEAPVGPGSLFLSASGEGSDGWVPVRDRRGAADTRLTLDAWSAAGRYQLDLGRATLAARASAYQEDRGAGLAGANSSASGQSASLTLAAAPSCDAPGYRLQGWVRGSDLANSSVSVSPDRSTATPANAQTATPAVGYGLNAALRRAGAGGSWELGADLRGADGETQELLRYLGGGFTRSRVAGGETLVAGVYGEGSVVRGRWLLTGAGRLDRWSDTGGRRLERDRSSGAVTLDDRPTDQDGVVPTGRIGLRRDLPGGLYLRSAAYAGFRPATLNELHRPFRVGNDITEANPGLKPERLYGTEAGVGGASPGASWSAAVFYNELDDAIANVTVGSGPFTDPIAGLVPAGGTLRRRANAGRVEAVGLETEGERRWGDRLTLRTALAWTRSRVEGADAAPQLTGLRPAQTPRLTITAGAIWRPAPRLSLDATLRYESLRFEDDLNTRRLDPAVQVDLQAEWRLRGRLSLYVAADNLLDAAIVTGRTADSTASYDAPRIVRVGVRLRAD